ncbi:uncharacterized protein A4U43_C05F22060 [Asparagus officinalis]|uniref:Uncharacterized protein n=1 Tax=Asparagus officinalis TaxID=4686 RepID=A0A5P1ETQ0_ASPOF|nr:uncharacterized protein A4U43_C05F22060 [Asparagus officinalis]
MLGPIAGPLSGPAEAENPDSYAMPPDTAASPDIASPPASDAGATADSPPPPPPPPPQSPPTDTSNAMKTGPIKFIFRGVVMAWIGTRITAPKPELNPHYLLGSKPQRVDPTSAPRRRRRSRRLGGIRNQRLADLNDGNVIRDLPDALHVRRADLGPVGRERHVSAAVVRALTLTNPAMPEPGRRLEHGGDQSVCAGDLVELLGAEVVDDDVEGEEVL